MRFIRFMSVFLTVIILLSWTTAIAGEDQGGIEPDPLSAASAILIEPESGRILYEYNAREKRPIASTTKVMTALIAVEQSLMEDVIVVKPDCVKIEGSSLYLDEGEHISMVDMLHGLMLRSGNDAAAAIGRHIAGDVDHFVNMMNRRAWELGMKDTSFSNPHGLDEVDHYSTAMDMALLGIEYLKHPILREIAIADEYISRGLENSRVRLFYNNNKLLVRDPRSIGIKIGWTDDAGRCLVAAARVGDMELVAVVLDAPDLYTDVSKLFDLGFENYKMQELVGRGQVKALAQVKNGEEKRVPLVMTQGVRFPVREGESISWTVHLKTPEKLEAPVKAGDSVGKAWITVDNYWQLEYDLVVDRDVGYRPGIFARFFAWVRGWWSD